MPSQIIKIPRAQAARFLVSHQFLNPPRFLVGRDGILEYLDTVASIQFDPVNVVARNPDLVLQARIKDYRHCMLHEMLYKEYSLFDAWDKQASVCQVKEWSYFTRHRLRMEAAHWKPGKPEYDRALELLELIRTHGHDHAVKQNNGNYVTGDWGFRVRVERAALEILYAVRKIHIADRVGTRRIFDLTENLLPSEILSQPDPNSTLEEYHDWHILRRIGGLGMAQAGATDYWLGIQHMKTPERKASLSRLEKNGHILPVTIQELQGKTFFIRAQDLDELDKAAQKPQTPLAITFLPPLDNLLWDRKLLSWIFDFDYVWEVYKKPEDRKFGYYTMPVLFGDRFIARMESAHDRKKNLFVIKHWWWEDGVKPDRAMKAAIRDCIQEFTKFLEAENFILSNNLSL